MPNPTDQESKSQVTSIAQNLGRDGPRRIKGKSLPEDQINERKGEINNLNTSSRGNVKKLIQKLSSPTTPSSSSIHVNPLLNITNKRSQER